MRNKGLFTLMYTGIIAMIVLFWKYSDIASEGLIMGIRLALISVLGVLTFRRKSLTMWIMFSMVAGIEVGVDIPDQAVELDRLSKIFLNLIKTVIAPLLLSTLVVGIAGHSNMKQVGRMGLKSLLYFELVTTVALFIGLGAINLTNAGKGLDPEVTASIASKTSAKAEKLLSQNVDHDVIVDIFPQNIAKSIAENQVLQIVVFAILFAIALFMVKDEGKKNTMLHFMESLSEVMFKFTHIVMYVAPFAVFGALASTVGKSGIEVLGVLINLVLTLYGALLVFVGGVLVPVMVFFKVPVKAFFKAVWEPVSIAFATSTSEAALPKAMENMEKFGVSRKVVAFVLPTGYSFNLDGTTLYLSLASVFVAQLSGLDMSFGEQVYMCLILMLTSKGVAGVRGASFIILVSTVQSLGIDPQKAFIILAVDALMDMARTAVNVIGNCLAAVVIARSEGEFHPVDTHPTNS
ncbi:MAG: cation:dicarboxylase symporter family transporter [Flavobacteriales bacterium]|nr:cation:dicarboxylase symporter family transporter [Flavobacteriales bacterium]